MKLKRSPMLAKKTVKNEITLPEKIVEQLPATGITEQDVPDAVRWAGHLGDLQGWLDNEDPVFAEVDALVEGRSEHAPRVLETPLDPKGSRQ